MSGAVPVAKGGPNIYINIFIDVGRSIRPIHISYSIHPGHHTPIKHPRIMNHSKHLSFFSPKVSLWSKFFHKLFLTILSWASIAFADPSLFVKASCEIKRPSGNRLFPLTSVSWVMLVGYMSMIPYQEVAFHYIIFHYSDTKGRLCVCHYTVIIQSLYSESWKWVAP